MAYSPTVISAAVGEKSLGKLAPNRPEDVKKVQVLLRKVFGSKAPALVDGVCDDAMKNAIADFQRAWSGAAGSIVTPNSQALRRLDRLANPLVLKPISMGKVVHGGYAVAFTSCDEGALPARESGYTRHLCVRSDGSSIDVTDRKTGDLIVKENVGSLLEILDNLNCWGTTVKCYLQVRYRGSVISTSDPQFLKAPVQPHNGRMLPLDESNNGPKLLYLGDPEKKEFYGRMFAQVAGYEKPVFVFAGKFETDNSKRGFDCITYVGTTCGGSNLHMHDSRDTCASLNTTAVEHSRTSIDPKTKKLKEVLVTLDDADPADVKDFFSARPAGFFLMYSGGHIVIVGNGNVYEFKASAPSGYSCTPVATWLAPYKTKKLTVRKLPGRPARVA